MEQKGKLDQKVKVLDFSEAESVLTILDIAPEVTATLPKQMQQGLTTATFKAGETILSHKKGLLNPTIHPFSGGINQPGVAWIQNIDAELTASKTCPLPQ